MAPIFLPNLSVTKSSDNAGVLIDKTVLPTYTPGPYKPDILPEHLRVPDELRYVPPLQYFCIKPLIQNVDAIDFGGCPRVPYDPTSHYSVFKGFIAFFNSELETADMMYVDPRVWGALIQIYSALPNCFSTYTLPLSDTHLTMLQGIKSTPNFTLITVLDMASQSQLNDETIGALKPLTNLCVLDISGTQVGSWGVRRLSMCLVGNGSERSGPWRIRIWSMRSCRKVDGSVADSLSKFPLLSVIDLRDTGVKPSAGLTGFSANPPPSHDGLYYPNPPLEWIPSMTILFPEYRLFEADPQRSPPHVLHINRLHHSRSILGVGLRSVLFSSHAQHVGDQNSVVIFLPNGRQASHTAHGLAQEAEEAAAEQRRLKGLLRWQKQHPEQWRRGIPDEKWWYGHDEQDSDCGSQCWGSDLDENPDFDDFGDSEDEEDLQHMLSYMENAHSQDLAVLEETLRQSNEQDVQNEVAAMENARETSELEAHKFYAKSKMEKVQNALRLRGGALPSDLHRMVCHNGHRTTRSLGGSSPPGTPEDTPPPLKIHRPPRPSCSKTEARDLMFYRVPPSFDSIPDNKSVGNFKRKNTDNELISVKRRKGSTAISDSSRALLDRRRKTPRTQAGPSTNIVPGSADPPPIQSKNPFLAKRKMPLQRLDPIAVTAAVSASVPPSKKSRPIPSKNEKSRSTATRAQKGSQNSKGHTNIEVPKVFDLKAWAVKTK